MEKLFPKWPEKEQTEFSNRRELIEKWKDFFISYTTRDAVKTNQVYKELILLEFGEEIKPAGEQINYVARALAKYMECANLKGFVDYMEMEPDDFIKEKILKLDAQVFRA